MTNEPARQFAVDLAVIGTGIAGFAAAVFAANRGLATAIAGNTGALAYTTGYLDLLGRRDGGGEAIDDPWQAQAALSEAEPRHPLGRVPVADIRDGFAEFTAFLGRHGLAYTAPGERNLLALTPVGTCKRTLCVPATMASGPRALASRTPSVIVDVEGLKGFSGREFVANLGPRWPGLATRRIAFPGLPRGEVYPEVMARALEVPATRRAFADALREAAGGVTSVGVPAILGMYRPDDVHGELERLSGLTIFEIPTMPPAVPGVRLRELLEQALPRQGVTLIPQQKVTALKFDQTGAVLDLADAYGAIRVRAAAVILATGRFLSGGLVARRDGIVEPLVDLPVTQPPSRADWYGERYTDPRGHPVHRAGLEVDAELRPLGRDGRPHSERLFAAGVNLAHQDWIRSRSGAGIAIATARRAVAAAARLVGPVAPAVGADGQDVRRDANATPGAV